MFDQTFICIDAIDEMETDNQTAFMKIMREILHQPCDRIPGTRTPPAGTLLFFTARLHIKDMVTQVLGPGIDSQSVTITANHEDIRKYILHLLDLDSHPKLMNNDLKEQLLTRIPENSQGM